MASDRLSTTRTPHTARTRTPWSGALSRRHEPAEQRSHRARPTRLHHVFERSADAFPDSVALEYDGRRLTYRDLDERANRLANYLLTTGLEPGSRVGLLLERSVEMYVALLASLKAAATFVPIDPAAPAERVAYIAGDSGLDLILSLSPLAESCSELPAGTRVVYLDEVASAAASAPRARPSIAETGDPICYIIYTSGSTGRPKGVEIAQSSICNFIDIVPEIYGVTPSDRVYQGMTIAFDFSIEEIWPTWAVAATLVAGPTDGRRVGTGLADFLEDAAITMIYCVPTVLSTLDRSIPSIRTVNVGGEACPPELVERWGRSGRRMLNTYGPTEATVTCTWAELVPGKAVTIGRPLPTYTITLLDDDLVPVPQGAVGEICVGGPGVARGYVNRPDLTADRFIPDPTGPEGWRIYRTGDLGRIAPNGEIEYLGRADSEVKVRGHRVDLQEIESVMLEDEHVAGAVVRLLTAPGTAGELAGYLLLTQDAPATDHVSRVHATLRRRLPAYMVPAYLETVDVIPMLPSGKADRGRLPEPLTTRLIGSLGKHVSPQSETETRLVAIWERALRLPAGSISVEADFFEELGGHSLLAATLVSNLRSGAVAGAERLSIVDLYANPTVRTLARYIDEHAVERAVTGGSDEVAGAAAASRPEPPAWWRVATFAFGQISWIYLLWLVLLLPLGIIYSIHRGDPAVAVVQQLVLTLPLSYLVGRWVMPLLGVRVLTHGLTEGTYPLWGTVHLRVWAAQKAMTLSPMSRLAGSPWACPYLRAAGARIGGTCHIGTAHVPLPRFLDLGEGATIGYGAHLDGFEIADGVLRLGTVSIGSNAVIAANAVLHGPCVVGPGAILREQSLLQTDQVIPDGETWSGSPAGPQSTKGDPVFDLMADCPLAPRTWPRNLLPAFVAGVVVLEFLPLLALAPIVALVWWTLLEWGEVPALAVTAATGPVFVLVACSLILIARRFALLETPVGIHHLRSQLGLEKWFGDKLLELSLELTNSMYATLYTPIWLRMLGAKVGKRAEVSTIANIDPDLLTLEDDCFVADMASVGSATYCNGHVAFRATEVGERAFVGNASFIPSGTHLGDGSLIGVGSVPPVSGVGPGTSWLGSPPFYLPRREIYAEFTESQTFRPRRTQVINRYLIEFVRMVLPASLLALSTFGTLFALSYVADRVVMWAVVLLTPVLALTTSVVLVVLVAVMKWLIVGRYKPRVEPLWSGFVRRTEFVTGIYEATAVPVLLALLSGTPFLGAMLRLFGARVGHRALIDTTYLTEFDLVRVDDDVYVGPEASLQTHLFEDRVMKMGTIDLHERVSIGGRSVVLYGSDIGADARLASLSLVMKGERLEPGTAWVGIPAQPARRGAPSDDDGSILMGSDA